MNEMFSSFITVSQKPSRCLNHDLDLEIKELPTSGRRYPGSPICLLGFLGGETWTDRMKDAGFGWVVGEGLSMVQGQPLHCGI